MTTNNDADPKKYPLEEYKDVTSNMRQFGNMRFAQLTLFIAINGALIALSLKPIAEVSYGPRKAIRIMGGLLTIVFCIMEERSTNLWKRFKERAALLEEELGFNQYKSWLTPPRVLQIEINATNGVRLLFISSLIFWVMHWFKGW